ncbi:hypothetical protein [Dasineura jujubifolia toursvirus 2a]|nr:hypothetical protein [Dasineura jujubifolia toursvirus 2a]
MYPLIGKNVYVDYGFSKFLLKFVDETVLKIEGMLGDKEVKEIVEYSTVLVDNGIYMVYWFEPVAKTLVTQTQNLNNMRVYSNILILPTTEFFHYKGKLTIMKEENQDSRRSDNNKKEKTIKNINTEQK